MPYQKLRAPKSLQRSSRMPSHPASEVSRIHQGNESSSRHEDGSDKRKPVRINYIVKDLPLY